MTGANFTGAFGKPVAARRVSKNEFEQATGCVVTAEREASRIIEDAKAIAEGLRQSHSDREAELEKRAHELNEAAFRECLDHENAVRRAAAAAEVLDEAARMRAEFDAVTPWLNELIQVCLRKIIGSMDKADVVAGAITEAVAELKARNGLSLRVAQKDIDEVREIAASHPNRFSAISSVYPDADLTEGTILLEGKGGFVDIGIEAQLRLLSAHISAHIPATEDQA